MEMGWGSRAVTVGGEAPVVFEAWEFVRRILFGICFFIVVPVAGA